MSHFLRVVKYKSHFVRYFLYCNLIVIGCLLGLWDFALSWNALISVCIPSGTMTAKATPRRSPAPMTDTRWSFSSLMGMNRGSEPAAYEPNNITRLKMTNCESPSILDKSSPRIAKCLNKKWRRARSNRRQSSLSVPALGPSFHSNYLSFLYKVIFFRTSLR